MKQVQCVNLRASFHSLPLLSANLVRKMHFWGISFEKIALNEAKVPNNCLLKCEKRQIIVGRGFESDRRNPGTPPHLSIFGFYNSVFQMNGEMTVGLIAQIPRMRTLVVIPRRLDLWPHCLSSQFVFNVLELYFLLDSYVENLIKV